MTKKLILLTLIFITLMVLRVNGQMVKGYFPYYRSVAQANAVNYTQLTDVIYAFADLDANGNLAILGPGGVGDMSVFNAVKANCTANGVRLWLAIGGWGLSGNFSGVAGNATRRTTLANASLSMCTTHGLAGIDIDWEFPGAGDAANYTLMLQAIKGQLGATYKLSAALGGESFNGPCSSSGHAVNINSTAFAYLDYGNIMTYDAPGCYTNHTGLDFMQASMDGWNAKGLPYSKMVAGIAFYGKCATGGIEYFNLSAPAPSTYFNDADGINGGHCYDSKPTIQAKTNWAMCTRGAPGMMIWEISQDRNDAYALLPVLKAAVNACACPFSDPNLGPDASLCGVASVNLNSGIATNSPSRTFTWKKDGVDIAGYVNSTTANQYTATAAGTYDVIIKEGTCTKTDQVIITSTLPTPALGTDKNICNPSFYTLTPSNLAGFPGSTTWQWSLGGTPIAGETSSSLTPVRKAGTYRLTASVGGCASTFDDIVLTSGLPTPVDACAATAGTVPVSIANPGLGAGPYYWFTTLTGGASVNTGTSYSPSISSTTTYYVQDGAGISSSVGGNAAFGAPDWSGTITNKKMDFTTNVAGITITSVDVYVQEWADVTGLVVTIETSGGAVIGSTTPVSYDNIANGAPYKLTINTSAIPALAAAGTYRIYFSAGAGAPRYSTTGYNYTEGTNSVILTGGTRYFTNIQFTAGSACGRLPVIAKIGSCGALPVTFAKLTAEDAGSYALVSWSTSFELNNDHFEIERSSDGIHFYAVTNVKGSGNSNSMISYIAKDYTAPAGKIFYRIAQVDVDGTKSYSGIVSLERSASSDLQIAPNPFENTTEIHVKDAEGKVKIRISDLAGNVVFEKEEVQNGKITIGDNLTPGVYIVQVQADTYSYSKKIVKVH
ncbi:MAG: T9SS type A sorting domain-containing protein [Cytophagaceae bacterium]|nr:T9SS type A sorting domain-containing protein [Cytophagaceae bacterium]